MGGPCLSILLMVLSPQLSSALSPNVNDSSNENASAAGELLLSGGMWSRFSLIDDTRNIRHSTSRDCREAITASRSDTQRRGREQRRQRGKSAGFTVRTSPAHPPLSISTAGRRRCGVSRTSLRRLFLLVVRCCDGNDPSLPVDLLFLGAKTEKILLDALLVEAQTHLQHGATVRAHDRIREAARRLSASRIQMKPPDPPNASFTHVHFLCCCRSS